MATAGGGEALRQRQPLGGGEDISTQWPRNAGYIWRHHYAPPKGEITTPKQETTKMMIFLGFDMNS